MVNSRTKGKNGELRVTNLYKEIFKDAKRNYQSRGSVQDGPDVENTPYWIEVKTYNRFWGKAQSMVLARMALDSKDRPAILHVKENGQPPLVVMREDIWLDALIGLYGQRRNEP